MTPGFLHHCLDALGDAPFAQVDRHDDQLVASGTGHVKHETKLSSPILHILFKVGEEPVEV
jgi:hypothetical protein